MEPFLSESCPACIGLLRHTPWCLRPIAFPAYTLLDQTQCHQIICLLPPPRLLSNKFKFAVPLGDLVGQGSHWHAIYGRDRLYVERFVGFFDDPFSRMMESLIPAFLTGVSEAVLAVLAMVILPVFYGLSYCWKSDSSSPGRVWNPQV